MYSLTGLRRNNSSPWRLDRYLWLTLLGICSYTSFRPLQLVVVTRSHRKQQLPSLLLLCLSAAHTQHRNIWLWCSVCVVELTVSRSSPHHKHNKNYYYSERYTSQELPLSLQLCSLRIIAIRQATVLVIRDKIRWTSWMEWRLHEYT